MAELLDAAPALRASWASLNAEEQATATMLLEAKQEHLFSAWPPAGEAEADKKRLLAQARLPGLVERQPRLARRRRLQS
jgi:hypothetical protein